MKRLFLLALIFCFPSIFLFSEGFYIPELDVYSEVNSSSIMSTSYKLDMAFDTGLKYGLKIGAELKNYNITTLNSNLISLSSLTIYSKPFDIFSFGYFLGKNVTLGDTLTGYRGFQFHQRPNFDYFGYKDITGTGIEGFMDFFNETFQPHLYIYQPNYTNLINLDSVLYLKMENYTIEGYFGFNNIDLYDAVINNALQKRFGLFIKTVYGKADFMMGLFSPDSLITNVPLADSYYLNATEHIILGYLEQTLTIFCRPSSYNGYAENISNDFDFYIATGVKIDDVGAGIENSLLISSNYQPTDRAGLYCYFFLNSLRYKLGIYYNLTGNAFSSAYGGFINISGSI